jgi:glycosyltransferase involved in cell wall biosynthesis
MIERDISVFILSYNRGDFLCEAIESIMNQTIKPKQIVVFDNGSNMYVYNRVVPYLDLGVKWVGSDVTHSPIWNFNRAITFAESEYVVVLHDDDKLCVDFIEKQLNFMELHLDVGAVTCNGYLINKNSERVEGLVRRNFVGGRTEYYSSPIAVATRYANDSCLPFSPFVYRTTVVRGQLMSEGFGKVVDAVYFCELARKSTLAYKAEALYECRVHIEQDSNIIPETDLERLDKYFKSLCSGSESERTELERLLRKQYTSRQIVKLYRACWPQIRILSIVLVCKEIDNAQFSIRIAAQICIAAITRRAKQFVRL